MADVAEHVVHGAVFSRGWSHIYVRGADDWIAMSPDSAVQAGLSGATVDVFGFVPAKLVAARHANGAIEVTFDVQQSANGTAIFESRSDRYDVILTACLSQPVWRSYSGFQ